MAALVATARTALGRRPGRLAPTRRAAAVVAGCALLLPLGYWALRTGPFFAVRVIEVKGAPPALSREVKAALEPVVGGSLLALDGDDVIARVESLPQVAQVTYDRAFPQTLVVTIRREVGRAVLRQEGRSWLVSVRGRVVRPVPRRSHEGLPRIWVAPSVRVRVGDVLADPAARRSVRALTVLRAEPLPVDVHAVNGRGPLTFSLARGMELRLGDASDLRLKLAVAGRILQVVQPPAASERLFLDVSVPERPVVGSTVKSKVEVES